MRAKDRLSKEVSNQLGLFSANIRPVTKEDFSKVKRGAKSGSVVWIDPRHLIDHPLNTEYFGSERLIDIDDLVLSIGSGYDSSRPIKAVKRKDGTVVIIDGHRRKRAAITLNCQVPITIQSLKNEGDELEEMILCNLVCNRSYKSCGIGKAVQLIQMIRPRNVKHGRPRKKSVAQEARIIAGDQESSKKIKSQLKKANSSRSMGDSGDSRRAYYARLLGISEKRFRTLDYILKHGTEEEKRELDFGPRTLAQLHKAVRARVSSVERQSTVDARRIANTAQTALRANKRFFTLIERLDKSEIEGLESSIEAITAVARNEVKGTVPEGSTIRHSLNIFRKLFNEAPRSKLRGIARMRESSE